MKFEKHFPNDLLKPYIKYYVVSEMDKETEYKVFPISGLVMGFQYKGHLTAIKDSEADKLKSAGVSGLSDSYRVFKNSADIGSVLVYFTETGFSHFASQPVHELFNQSISLDTIFDKNRISEVEEKLADSKTDIQRIRIVEQFLRLQLRNIETDRLITEAVKLIYQHKGNIRIKDLNERLLVSQSPFEKRFRKVVGTTPKKFASVIRFNSVLTDLSTSKSLSEICYENNFFDQAHFIKDFKLFTGETPEQFKRFL